MIIVYQKSQNYEIPGHNYDSQKFDFDCHNCNSVCQI